MVDPRETPKVIRPVSLPRDVGILVPQMGELLEFCDSNPALAGLMGNLIVEVIKEGFKTSPVLKLIQAGDVATVQRIALDSRIEWNRIRTEFLVNTGFTSHSIAQGNVTPRKSKRRPIQSAQLPKPSSEESVASESGVGANALGASEAMGMGVVGSPVAGAVLDATESSDSSGPIIDGQTTSSMSLAEVAGGSNAKAVDEMTVSNARNPENAQLGVANKAEVVTGTDRVAEPVSKEGVVRSVNVAGGGDENASGKKEPAVVKRNFTF